MINTYIAALAAYGLKTGLITADDRIFAINSILAALDLDDYEEPENIPDMELEEILKGLLDFACSKKNGWKEKRSMSRGMNGILLGN